MPPICRDFYAVVSGHGRVLKSGFHVPRAKKNRVESEFHVSSCKGFQNARIDESTNRQNSVQLVSERVWRFCNQLLMIAIAGKSVRDPRTVYRCSGEPSLGCFGI